MQKSYFPFFRFLVVLLLILFFSSNAKAQKEGNVWHFGYGAGIDFNGNKPTPITNGVINAAEGCASIADSNGNLLFYTNGVRVWNKNHVLMPNGIGLMGHISSTQSALILPQPNNDSIYYIFTVDAVTWSNKGFRYSKVNMKLNGGLGDVEVNAKNISILAHTTEQISATYHANGRDIWVIVHQSFNANFYAFLLTPIGLITPPVISTIGEIHNGVGMSGQLKISPDGRKLACSVIEKSIIQLFDFDNSTGLISKLITTLSFNTLYPYGCEFSPDVTKLYTTSRNYAIKENELNQFDISTNDSSEITNSKTLIASHQGIADTYYNSLQLAPDRKIYIASSKSFYLSVIHAPNKTGSASNYENEGFHLAGKRSEAGLPNFISNLFYFPYNENTFCYGDSNTTCFEFTGTPNYDSLVWDFGDGTPAITVFENNICHFYQNLGVYKVKLAYWANGKSYISKQIISIPSEITSTVKISICKEDSILLEGSFQKEAGEYKDTIFGGNRYGCDSIIITNLEIYDQAISTTSISICHRDSILLAGRYRKEKGEYNDTIIGGGKFGCDSIVKTNLEIYDQAIGTTAVSICQGDSIFLAGRFRKEEGVYNDTLIGASRFGCDSVVSIGLSYKTPSNLFNQYDGCPGFSVTVGSNIYSTSGTYIDVVDGCDTVVSVLTIYPEPDFSLIKTEDVCNQKKGSVRVSELIGSAPFSFFWSNGATDSAISDIGEGIYELTVTDGNGCLRSKSVGVLNIDEECNPLFLLPTAFSPNGDGLNDVFEPKMKGYEVVGLTIYNRWGEKVFSSQGQGWDGTSQGVAAQNGVYTYTLILVDEEGEKLLYAGVINLVR